MKPENKGNSMDKDKKSSEADRPGISRRRFLLATGGVAGVTVSTILYFKFRNGTEPFEGEVAEFSRKKVASLSELEADSPVAFHYPFEDLSSLNFIVKLGTPAGGGVGPDDDIVAFSSLCTHAGGDLSDTAKTYLKDHKICGPCPLHLTTFDLTRHGMVVAGHATESLPQVVLEVEGDDVYATGILGLIYGKRDTLDVSDI